MKITVARGLGVVMAVVVGIGFYGVHQPVPEHVGYASDVYRVPDTAVELLIDRTYQDEAGKQVFEHEIFDTVLEHIRTADTYILADMFLFNDQRGLATSVHRELSTQLSTALIDRSADRPDMAVTVITDPINSAYGSYLPTPLAQLHESDINFITTDLTALRDSNPLYSAWWRAGLRFVPAIGGNWLPNPFDPNHPKATIPAYLSAFNFKANHRKLLLTDVIENGERQWRTLVTSMNPHDGSSRHSNVAVVVHDALMGDVFRTEQAVALMSGGDITPLPPTQLPYNGDEGEVGVQLLTEGNIKERILENINTLQNGDELLLAVFYFSDRDIVRAIKAADDRGAQIRILLDPNKNAFGREKSGVPNRQVAHELVSHSGGNTTVRWCATVSEQCHSKIVITRVGTEYELILGSANLTRRNLDTLNLETNVRVAGTADTTAIADAVAFFEDQWSNAYGRTYSLPYEAYADSSIWRTLQYRFGEFTGVSHY